MANALQIEFLAAGITDNNGNPLNGGKIYTYAAGTTTPKTCWTEADKSEEATNPIILNSRGQANVYAEGNYKFIIKDADDNTIITLDNMYYIVLTEAELSVKSISANYTLTTEHNFILISATSGNVTLTLYSASDEYREIVVKRLDSTPNTVTIDAHGTETIDGSATMTLDEQYSAVHLLADGANWHVVTDNPDILGYPPTATPTASRIPLADTDGLLDDWVTPYTPRVGWADNCVNKAVVDSNGRANFLAAGSGLAVNLDGTPTPMECLIKSAYCKRSTDGVIDERIYDKNLTTVSAIGLRNTTANTLIACRIPDGEQWGGELENVILTMWRTGSPTGNIWVEIREDSSGEPGSTITNGQSNNVDVSTLATGSPYTEQQFTFSTNPTLSKNTTYWIVVNGDFTISDTNYVLVNSETEYADQFGIKRYNGSSWSVYDADGIFVFTMKYAELADDTTVFLWAEKPSEGEEIETLGFSVAPPFYGDAFNADLYQNTQDTTKGIRTNSTNLQVAGRISPFNNHGIMFGGLLSSITVYLTKTGSPTGDIWIEIRKDNSGEPGDLILNGTSDTIDVSTISGGAGEEVEFSFAEPLVFMPLETYWVVVNADYTESVINYVRVHYQTNYSSAWGIKNYDGAAWNVVSASSGIYVYFDWDAPATDQHWFDIANYVMKRYTGAEWEEVDRIFLGEAITASGSVSSVVNYALRGEYREAFTVAASTSYEKEHNIGVDNRFINAQVFGIYDRYANTGVPPIRIVMGDADSNGYLFQVPTLLHRYIKLLTMANPIYDTAAAGWQTSGEYLLMLKRMF